MKLKHSNVKPVSPAWERIIDEHLKSLRVKGLSKETIRTRREHMHYMGRTIGLLPQEISSDDLLNWCAEQEWAVETRRGRYNTFRLFWQWAAQKGLLTDISGSLPKIRQRKGAPRPTPKEIYEDAISNADRRTRLILRLACEYGLRRSEISQIRVPEDLARDLLGWTLIVHGKGRKKRLIPLEDDMAQELIDLDPGWAFRGNQAGHLSPAWIGRLASSALNEHWTLHTLRHRFATEGWRATRDLYGVQQLLGHASPDTSLTYIAPDIEGLRAIVSKVALSNRSPRNSVVP